MKHLILVLVLTFSVFLKAEGVSFVQYQENYATFYPFDGTEPEELKAGLPLYPGDKIKTERNSFVEAVLSDGNLLWIGSFSDLDLRAVSGTEGYPDKRTYLFLNSGEIAYELLKNPSYNEEPVIGFSAGDVYLLSSGVYYVNSESRGNVRVLIIEGKAEIATSGGSVYLRSGEEATVYSDGFVDRKRISLRNEFFVEKVEERRALRYKSQSTQYTGRQFSSSNYVLDNYGTWIYEPEFSVYVWRPIVVVDWTPYYNGYWRWTPHGWFWVSYEPWGYLTYHYGRWVWTPRYGWVWVPGYTWAPAWVYWFWFDGYFGWCPIGYYDYWWYYRWDWWWGWPPCWYNDCYFGFKGRVNLSHLQRDFWVFAEARNFGKKNLQINKGISHEFKGKEGLVFAMNLPLDKKEILRAGEHFISQKNILKDDLTPVFKIHEKPTIEAKNILSSSKEFVSKERRFLRTERENLNRENVFEDLRPSKRMNIEKNKGISSPRAIEREKIEGGGIQSPKVYQRPSEDKPERGNKREPVKIETPSREDNFPRKIDKDESQPIKKDSYNYYKREPVRNYEVKDYPKREVQPQYNSPSQREAPSYRQKEYIKPSYERQSPYQPNTAPSYNYRQSQNPSTSQPHTYSPSKSKSGSFSSTPSHSSPSFSHSHSGSSSSSSSSSSSRSISSSHSSSSSSSGSGISRSK